MKQWSRKYKKCIKCEKTQRPHKGNGLCILCYDLKRAKTPNGRANQARYRDKYRQEIRDRQRQERINIKIKLFSLLGDKCSQCGIKDIRVLQIDHINGNGRKDRGNLNPKDFYRYAFNKVKNGNKEYQLLCANCNWIKRYTNNEFYKQKRKV
jgi:hypothetical protein